MTVASYAKETSNTTGTGTYDLAGPVSPGNFRGLVDALSNDPTVNDAVGPWADVGYTAYTLDEDGNYVDVEVGKGTVTDAVTDTLSRADADVSFSTNSNNRVNWGAGPKYIAITLNVAELIQT